MKRPCYRLFWFLSGASLVCANLSCSSSNAAVQSMSVLDDTETASTLSTNSRPEDSPVATSSPAIDVDEPPSSAAVHATDGNVQVSSQSATPSTAEIEARRAARRAREQALAEKLPQRPPATELKAVTPAVPVEQTVTPAEQNETEVADTVVAVIGDYQIEGKAFHDRMLQELAPSPYDVTPNTKTVTRDEVIRILLAEKAIAMEARKQGLDKSERVLSSMVTFSERELVNRLGNRVIDTQVKVSDDEIERAMKVNPKLDRERATLLLRRNKARGAFDAYTNGLIKALKVKKAPENFARAAQIHDTLLHHPKKPRKHNARWILRDQILNELSPEDAAVVLASYEGGEFTVKDLLMALHGLSPPGRPRNLGTVEGVEAFLMKSIRKPLQVRQAKNLGLDQTEDYLRKLREHEDRQLYGAVHVEKHKEVAEPNEAEIEAFYQTVKDVVGKRDLVKARIIWCRDRAAAEKAKTELVSGKPFAQVQQAFNIDENDTQERDFYASSEGFLWPQIWAGEPGDVVGPILGLHTVNRTRKFDWRVLQVISKEEGTPKALDDNLKDTLKWGIQGDRSAAHFKAYADVTLAKYAYTIIQERLKTFDPRNIP